ncbi:MAG: hypothetical protein AB1500_07605 [Bacillota bacterium]
MRKCKCCGQCCTAFYTQLDSEALLKKALEDEALGLTMLESDAVFIVRHCRRLTPEEARARSPAVVGSPGWPNGHYWACEYLNHDRLCQLQLDSGTKPRICREYPWYGGGPQAKRWLLPGCGYSEIPE